MASQLKLQVLLSAVDKITRPLKSIQKAAGTAAKDVSNTQKHIKELNRQAGQIDGYRKVSRSLGITSNELSAAQTEAQRLGRELAQTQNPTKGMVREFDRAQAQVKKLKLQQNQLTQTQRNHRSVLRESGIDTRNLSTHQRDLTRQLGEANRALDQQKSKLERLAQQQKQLAKARQTYDSTKQLQGQIAGQGAKFVAGGSAAAYGAARILAPGLAYGEQMSELQAVSRLSKDDERYKKLAQQSRDLGASTAFSAAEVGAGQTFLARAGFTPEAIHASMQDVLNMALANGTDLAQTADIASNIGGVFKLDPEIEGNMKRVANVLSGVSARANVDLSMLGDTMKYLGSGSGLGLSIEEAAAMAGMLGNIGIQGSQAGTTLRAMTDRLAGPAAAGAKAMASLGLEVADAHGNMRKMPDIIKDVADATKDMGNVQRAAILKDIFGAEAGSGMAELVAQQGAGALVELLAQLESIDINENANMAATRADNAAGDIKGLASAWEEIGISLMDTNDGAIRELIQSVTSIARATGNWIKENPELVATLSKIFGVIVGLSIAGGTLALTIAGLLGPFAMLRYATSVLGIKALPALLPMLKAVGAAFIKLGVAILTTPVGWVLLAVAAIAGAGYLIYKNWGVVSEFIGEFWQGFKNMAAIGLDLIKGVFGYTPLGLVINNWGAITGYFSELWTEIKSGFAGGLSGIAALIVNFSPLGLFYRAFAGVLSYFGVELPATFTGFGGMILDGLISGITGKLGAVKDKVVGAGESVKGWFKNTLGIKSPSKVFAQYGDDTMAGLAIGLAKNHDPEQQVTGIAKRLKAAGAAIAIGSLSLPATAEVQTAHHEQRTISEQLVPAHLSAPADAQRVITERAELANLTPVADARRTISEQLVPARLSAPADAQRVITDRAELANLTPVADARRTISEQLAPAHLSAPADAQRLITERAELAHLTPAADAQRTISEQLAPAHLSAPADAQRLITERAELARLTPVADAQRTISERREIVEQLKPAGLPAIPDATRVIKEQIERAELPDTSDAVAQIKKQAHAKHEQSQSMTAAATPAASVTQDYSMTVAPGAIVINAAPGMDEQDIARQVQRALESYQRQQAARTRGRLGDLE